MLLYLLAVVLFVKLKKKIYIYIYITTSKSICHIFKRTQQEAAQQTQATGPEWRVILRRRGWGRTTGQVELPGALPRGSLDQHVPKRMRSAAGRAETTPMPSAQHLRRAHPSIRECLRFACGSTYRPRVTACSPGGGLCGGSAGLPAQ